MSKNRIQCGFCSWSRPNKIRFKGKTMDGFLALKKHVREKHKMESKEIRDYVWPEKLQYIQGESNYGKIERINVVHKPRRTSYRKRKKVLL